MDVLSDIKTYLQDDRYRSLSDMTKRVLIKDYLIAYFLDFIYHHPKYRKLIFYGGTCAKVVYGLPRLSEDVDMENSAEVDIDEFAHDLETYLNKNLKIVGSNVYVQKGGLGINRATVRIPGVLKAVGLAPIEGEKLHIKIEMSNHKQIFTLDKTPVVMHGKVMTIAHFDKPSLMAGKMIACMERVFKKGATNALVKGRDWYDLWWYLSQGVVPNEEKLVADSEGNVDTKQAWEIISDKVAKLKRRDLEVDLLPFFTDQIFINDWLDNFQEYFGRLLRG